MPSEFANTVREAVADQLVPDGLDIDEVWLSDILRVGAQEVLVYAVRDHADPRYYVRARVISARTSTPLDALMVAHGVIESLDEPEGGDHQLTDAVIGGPQLVDWLRTKWREGQPVDRQLGGMTCFTV